MFRAIVFFGLITAALGSEKLDMLVNAAASFSATIQQQLETLQSDPSPHQRQSLLLGISREFVPVTEEFLCARVLETTRTIASGGPNLFEVSF